MNTEERKRKFQEFEKLVESTKKDGIDTVIIHHPEVLGDNYEELVFNLNRLSDAELALRIVPQEKRRQ